MQRKLQLYHPHSDFISNSFSSLFLAIFLTLLVVLTPKLAHLHVLSVSLCKIEFDWYSLTGPAILNQLRGFKACEICTQITVSEIYPTAMGVGDCPFIPNFSLWELQSPNASRFIIDSAPGPSFTLIRTESFYKATDLERQELQSSSYSLCHIPAFPQAVTPLALKNLRFLLLLSNDVFIF